MRYNPDRFSTQVLKAAVLILAVAFSVHLAETWIMPAVPVLMVLILLILLYRLILGQWKR
jgi:hypothetical protein